MQIIRVLPGNLSKMIQDREDICLERSRSWGRNRLSARGLQYTLLTTVEYSDASTWCCTDQRCIVSYLTSKIKKRNADGCSSCYSTAFSATAVTGTTYQYELRTAVAVLSLCSIWERISRITFLSPQGGKDPKEAQHGLGHADSTGPTR